MFKNDFNIAPTTFDLPLYSEQQSKSDTRNMLCSILILKILFCAALAANVPKPQNEIMVAFSQRQPFVFRSEDQVLKGLDVLIVENFAKKFQLQIKYIEFNTSLNVMLNDEGSMGHFLLAKNLR